MNKDQGTINVVMKCTQCQMTISLDGTTFEWIDEFWHTFHHDCGCRKDAFVNENIDCTGVK